MFLDASAIVAILVIEEDGPVLQQKLEEADRAYTSGMAIYEATLGIARVLNISIGAARDDVRRFIVAARVKIIAISADIGYAALSAFERFGRGRHPARLNMGDCFAYACARALSVPLLYKGDDFSQTDIATA
jgi:ribonuclease VapC